MTFLTKPGTSGRNYEKMPIWLFLVRPIRTCLNEKWRKTDNFAFLKFSRCSPYLTTKYNWDVNWYTSGKYHGFIITNFAQDISSGHIIYQIGPLFVCTKRKEPYILKLFIGSHYDRKWSEFAMKLNIFCLSLQQI